MKMEETLYWRQAVSRYGLVLLLAALIVAVTRATVIQSVPLPDGDILGLTGSLEKSPPPPWNYPGVYFSIGFSWIIKSVVGNPNVAATILACIHVVLAAAGAAFLLSPFVGWEAAALVGLCLTLQVHVIYFSSVAYTHAADLCYGLWLFGFLSRARDGAAGWLVPALAVLGWAGGFRPTFVVLQLPLVAFGVWSCAATRVTARDPASSGKSAGLCAAWSDAPFRRAVLWGAALGVLFTGAWLFWMSFALSESLWEYIVGAFTHFVTYKQRVAGSMAADPSFFPGRWALKLHTFLFWGFAPHLLALAYLWGRKALGRIPRPLWPWIALQGGPAWLLYAFYMVAVPGYYFVLTPGLILIWGLAMFAGPVLGGSGARDHFRPKTAALSWTHRAAVVAVVGVLGMAQFYLTPLLPETSPKTHAFNVMVGKFTSRGVRAGYIARMIDYAPPPPTPMSPERK